MSLNGKMVITSWAHDSGDEDDGGGSLDESPLPAPTSQIVNNTKVVTSYKYEDGKKYKIISIYKIEKLIVSKAVALRKLWKKYGLAMNDPPGPNPSNTICCEDVAMQFISNKDEVNMDKDDILQSLGNKNVVKCRYCEMDHWTLKCPYKEKFLEREGGPNIAGDIGSGSSGAGGTIQLFNGSTVEAGLRFGEDDNKQSRTKYVIPGLREGDKKSKREQLLALVPARKDEANTIRVTNLPEDIQDCDIKELFQPFGKITRAFLAKDRHTGLSKGFAFVNYERKEDGAKAIAHVNGFGYANLILNVEWARTSADSQLYN